MPRRLGSQTIDLFGQERATGTGETLDWPDAGRFPVNAGGYRVTTHVWQDLLESVEPLLITGYAGLDQFIDFVAQAGHARNTRVLFGHEPFPGRRERYELSDQDFTTEAERYWLSEGVSLLRSAAIIHTIEALKSGRVHARFLPGGRRMHAKIYCGDHAATVGSSNFTAPGLEHQYEANARFPNDGRSTRYDELRTIAENYWALGRDYNAALIELLRKLLRVVAWDEALARACAELLEGEWAEAYLRHAYLSEADTLWPSQKQGIAQALYVLSYQGSVLIADATGAGKTRMGTYLIGAVRDHILRSGRMRQGKSLMVCPPAVQENWEKESVFSGVALDIYSHGKLSHTKSRGHELTVESLRRAQILCVDEGHNFLNFSTNRTQRLLRNMADHVVLLTATPINRGVSDLLRIADMLGADNLSESTRTAFKKMLGVKRLTRTLTELEIETLRAEIQKFTVRRTKKVLNSLIDREPEKYRDKDGRLCRFPRHRPQVYTLKEPDDDRAIAERLQELADTLHGVTHFVRDVEMPEVLRRQGVTDERYLNGRLNSAKKLARYMVMRALRSSRAALIEHVEGTNVARDFFGIENFGAKAATGNIRQTLATREGRPPENRLRIALPDWLTDPEAHARVTRQDLATYDEIAHLARRLSPQREQCKADLLTSLLQQHALVLAFDSSPITLAMLRQLISSPRSVRCLLAWGDSSSDRDELLRVCAHGSDARGVIGLCSDSISEGVNLQQASTLVHLDMPSVVRIAEQRAGRVDRLDSPHKCVEVWWPQDAPEFALASDERFIERYETVDRLLGSNMPLPDHMQPRHRRKVTAEEMIQAFEQSEPETWDGIDDAFAPVRGLVQGKSALVEPQVYERYRSVNERVLSRVSLVRSHAPWAFFCLTAGSFAAPRWLLVPSYNSAPITALADVVEALRERLGDGVESLSLTDHGAAVLNRFLERLATFERQLLPRKKQRALEEMEWIIDRLLPFAAERQEQAWVEHLDTLKRMLINPRPDKQPDWDEVAALWLDVIRPVWFEKLASKRQKPLLLRDIRQDLLKDKANLIEKIVTYFRHFPILPPAETRIRACIVGVG